MNDVDSSLSSLIVTASSDNPTLVPNGNLLLGGAGMNRTLTVRPAVDQHGGPVTITVQASDGSHVVPDELPRDDPAASMMRRWLETTWRTVAEGGQFVAAESVLDNDLDVGWRYPDGKPGHQPTARFGQSGIPMGHFTYDHDGSEALDRQFRVPSHRWPRRVRARGPSG